MSLRPAFISAAFRGNGFSRIGLAVAFSLFGMASIAHAGDWSGRLDSLGVNQTVFALADDGSGNVIAGGDFTIAGHDTAARIARFDGNFWTAYGTGIGGTIRALAVYNGSVVAGGLFLTAGGSSIPYIARWNGSAWVAMGAGLNGPVDALLVKDGLLYAGGEFTQSGAASMKYIASWNGTSWSSLGTGLGG